MLGSLRAAAAPENDPTHGDYMGAFWGLELRGGIALRGADDELTPIGAMGVGVRIATLVSLVDFELATETMGFSRGDYDLRATSIAGELRLHPLFIRLLQGNTASLVLASIHLALGAGLEVLSTDGPAQDATHYAFGFRWGLGAEVPLTRPSAASWSLWLGLGWRMTITGFGGAPPGLRDLDRHAVWLSLSLRFHDIDFMRFPRPPELRDDE